MVNQVYLYNHLNLLALQAEIKANQQQVSVLKRVSINYELRHFDLTAYKEGLWQRQFEYQISTAALELNQGVDLDQVNWLEHVKVFDENDGDLSHQVTVFYGEVQTNEIGEYSVYYMVRNQHQKQITK